MEREECRVQNRRIHQFSSLKREFVKFRNRIDRPAFLGQRFREYLNSTVLDIGCDEAVLRKLIGPRKYAGVGMTPESDFKVNLEQEGKLPFADCSWDTVLCLDVLEHLDNLYELVEEIFRVARHYVILSLPNCWSQARRSLAKGKDSIWQYGLPATKPQDRHKWFFNTEEAWSFLTDLPKHRNAEIVEIIALENRRPAINRLWRHLKYPTTRQYLNLYPMSVVCVYRIL
jgi:SAM-dependent methyltransferase